MLELDKKMVELLQKGVTFTKLKTKTGLCSSDLVQKMNRLKEKGYLIDRNFNEYGVKFKIIDKPLMVLQNNVTITTGPKFSFLVISDTHIGNIYENIALIRKIYEYAEDNNIHYVFHLGDMIEGVAKEGQNSDRIKRDNVHDQVDYLTRYYPKSDKVETLYILGNHDYRCMIEGIDISKIISNRRLDMHFLGYKNSKLHVCNRNLLMHHPFFIDKAQKYDDEVKELYYNPDFDIIFRGHTHNNLVYVNDMNSLVINVPACYDSPSRKHIGLYEVTIANDDLELDSLIVDDSEVSHFATLNHRMKPKQLIKTPNDQISKFNNRVNKAKKI